MALSNVKAGALKTPAPSGITFKPADIVKVICTDIQPGKMEIEKLKECVPIGDNWKKYANFRDGVLYKFVAIERIENDGDYHPLVTPVEGKLIYPKGKFGLQLYQKVSQDKFWGTTENSKDFIIDVEKDGNIYQMNYSLYPGWAELKPEDRYLFWQKMASLSIRCGTIPKVEEIDGENVVDINSIHNMKIGDITSCVLSCWKNGDGKEMWFMNNVAKTSEGKWKRCEWDYFGNKRALAEALNRDFEWKDKDSFNRIKEALAF